MAYPCSCPTFNHRSQPASLHLLYTTIYYTDEQLINYYLHATDILQPLCHSQFFYEIDQHSRFTFADKTAELSRIYEMLANVLAKQKHKNSKQHSRTYFVHFASATICLMYVTGHVLQPLNLKTHLWISCRQESPITRLSSARYILTNKFILNVIQLNIYIAPFHQN